MNDSDRRLIEWAADKNHLGCVLPEGFRHRNGTVALVRRLVELGVMLEPRVGEPITKVALRAQAASAAWLANCPVPKKGEK